MKNHIFTAMTCRRARRLGIRTQRDHGYTVIIQPPLRWINTGTDVEGIGWVPKFGGPVLEPTTHTGWYRFKEDAEARAASSNAEHHSSCVCQLCAPTNPIHQPKNLDLVTG